jgi:hypothetical protein
MERDTPQAEQEDASTPARLLTATTKTTATKC